MGAGGDQMNTYFSSRVLFLFGLSPPFFDGRTTAEGPKSHKSEHQFTALDTFIKYEATASVNTFYEPAFMLLNPKNAS